MTFSRRLARFNKRVTNRIQGLYAWLIPPWAVILHRGRRSGTPYRTPLFAFKQDGTLVVALLYGTGSSWLANLRAGGGHVVRRGRTFVVGPPRMVPRDAPDSPFLQLSAPARRYCHLADELAVLDLGDRLPGFGSRRDVSNLTRPEPPRTEEPDV